MMKSTYVEIFNEKISIQQKWYTVNQHLIGRVEDKINIQLKWYTIKATFSRNGMR